MGLTIYDLARQQQAKYEDFVDKAVQKVSSVKRAIASKNRYYIPQERNTASIQQQLYEKGYFENLDYKRAVDGKWGKLTEAAYQKAMKDGWRGMNGKLVMTGINAIKQHKKGSGVTDPYIVIDKNKKKMYYMKGDTILEEQEITIGENRGDGYRPLGGATPYYSDLPMTTPAGIFTAGLRSSSPYMGKEPMYTLFDPQRRRETTVAIHSPATEKRLARLNNGTLQDNRVSYGCISPTLGVMRKWYDNKRMNVGDTIYVLPEMQGNYIYND